MAVRRKAPHERARARQRGRDGRTQLVTTPRIGDLGLHLHDDDLVRQVAKLLQNEHRVLERDEPRVGTVERCLHTIVRGKLAIPAVRGDRAGRTRTRHRANEDDALESGPLVVETLRHRGRVSAQILHDHVRGRDGGVVSQPVADEWSNRVIALISSTNAANERSHVGAVTLRDPGGAAQGAQANTQYSVLSTEDSKRRRSVGTSESEAP